MSRSASKLAVRTQDAPPVFQGSSQCVWMENHRPVQPLGPQSALDTAITSKGQPILFSYDATYSFQATVASDGKGSGWSNYSIADEVTAACGGQIGGFVVSQALHDDGSPGDISILAKMVVNSGACHQIWVLSGMDNAPDAAWLTDKSQRNWTQLAYFADNDPNNPHLPGVTAETLQVSDLRVLEVAPHSTTASGLVHVEGDGGVLQSFTLAMPRKKVKKDAPCAWTYIPPETTFFELKDAAAGAPQTASAVGVYKLYPNPDQNVPVIPGTYVRSGPRLLSFLQYGAQVVYFPILSDGNASAIATLPAGVYEGVPVTDLFVSDGANINLYMGAYDYSGNVPVPQPPAPWPNPITVANAPWLSSCSKLYAATDGTVVSLWGLTGGGSVFHIQAPYADRSDPTQWSTPVPLMANVATAAIHISAKRGLTSIFATQNQASPVGAVRSSGPNPANLNPYNPFGSNGPSLYELHKDHLVQTGGSPMGNSHWRKRPVHLPADNNYLTLQTYTHRIQFCDQYGNPASRKPVNIATTATTVIEVNNRTLTVTSAKGATATTDASGYIELLQDGASVSAPTLTFSLANTSAQVTVDPTAPVRVSMQNNINAGATDSNSIQQTSWYQLPQGVTIQQVQGCANDIATAQTQVTADEIRRHCEALAARRGVGDGIGSFFGDIWHAVCEVENEIQAFSVDLDNGIATITINFGEQLQFSAILNTFEDICGALATVINYVGAKVEDIFQWLAFIFDWENIITIQKNIQAFNAATIQNFTSLNLVTWGCNQLASEIQALAGKVSSFDAASLPDLTCEGNNQNNNTLQQQNLPANAPAGNDPRMSWGQSQLPSPSGTSGAATNRRPQPEYGDVQDALSQILADIVNFSNKVGSNLIDVAENQETISTAAQNVLASGATLIVDILNDLASAVAQLPQPIVSLATQYQTDLEAPLNIPLFTQLYLDATNGETLSWLSLASLLQAVPSTFVYATVVPGGAAGNFLSASELSSLQLVINNLCDDGARRKGVNTQRRLRDGQPSETAAFLRMALGVAHMCRCLSALALSEMPEDPKILAVPAGVVDTLVWGLETGLNIWIACAESGSPEAVDWANLAGACLGLIYCGSLDGGSLDGPSVQETVGCLSIVVGTWEIIVGIQGLINAEGGAETEGLVALTAYGVNEFLECVERVMVRLKETEAAEEVLGVRLALMAASGIGQIMAGVSELSAATASHQ